MWIPLVFAGAIALAGAGPGDRSIAAGTLEDQRAGMTVGAAVTSTEPPVDSIEPPPPFRLRYDGRELLLEPFTWCYGVLCVDGIIPDNPPSVGSPACIRIAVEVTGWRPYATFTRVDRPSDPPVTVTPEKGEDGWYVLTTAGPAGTYNVTLSASGPTVPGDMIAMFRWVTPVGGQPSGPAPTGSG